MKLKGIPANSANKNLHHNNGQNPTKKLSIKVKKIHVMTAIIKQDGKSIFKCTIMAA